MWPRPSTDYRPSYSPIKALFHPGGVGGGGEKRRKRKKKQLQAHLTAPWTKFAICRATSGHICSKAPHNTIPNMIQLVRKSNNHLSFSCLSSSTSLPRPKVPSCLIETDGPATSPPLTVACDTDAVIREELALFCRNILYVLKHTRSRQGHALGNIVASKAWMVALVWDAVRVVTVLWANSNVYRRQKKCVIGHSLDKYICACQCVYCMCFTTWRDQLCT